MDSNSEHPSQQPIEAPKAGEHVVAERYLPGIAPVIRDQETGEYRRAPSTPDAHGRHYPQVYRISLTPEAQEARRAGSMTPEEFRQARAENGTGPGGTKSPAYWEASSGLPRPAELAIDAGAELTVIGDQVDALGRKQLLVRFAGGDGNFSPGNGSRVALSEIGQINGQPVKDFFGEQVFAMPANETNLKQLKAKPVPKPSLLRRAAGKIFRR